jgi:hypothetical protein
VIYRHLVMRNLAFGTLPKFVALQKEKNALLEAAGLTPYVIWSPAFGGLNHLVLEAHFPSMADFEKEHTATKSIDGYAALNAQQLDYVLPGTASDTLQRVTLKP